MVDGTTTEKAESDEGVTFTVAVVAPDINVTTPCVVPNLPPLAVSVVAAPARISPDRLVIVGIGMETKAHPVAV
jgi:hypothetical protein